MRSGLEIGAAFSATIPALFLRALDIHLDPQAEAVIYGIAIVGAAFLLIWGVETAELRMPQALVLAILAVVAVLPEYAVDLYFAWSAGKDPEYAPYTIANMTGANRLLIGIGWPLIVFLGWLKGRKREVRMESAQRVELSFLIWATLYSFIIPLKGSLSLTDAFILILLFFLYIRKSSKAEVVIPELSGPSKAIASLPPGKRNICTLLLFLFPAGIILASASRFADGLIDTGSVLGVDEFIMVQWIAPLASETPEILAASIIALRGMGGAGLGVLISSKVNQWTLLVGTLPLVYCLSLGEIGSLPLDSRQAEEVFLTSAQSAFALVLLSRLGFSLKGAGIIFILFSTQLFFTATEVRLGYAITYLTLAVLLLARSPGRARGVFDIARDIFK